MQYRTVSGVEFRAAVGLTVRSPLKYVEAESRLGSVHRFAHRGKISSYSEATDNVRAPANQPRFIREFSLSSSKPIEGWAEVTIRAQSISTHMRCQTDCFLRLSPTPPSGSKPLGVSLQQNLNVMFEILQPRGPYGITSEDICVQFLGYYSKTASCISK